MTDGRHFFRTLAPALHSNGNYGAIRAKCLGTSFSGEKNVLKHYAEKISGIRRRRFLSRRTPPTGPVERNRHMQISFHFVVDILYAHMV